MKSKMSFDSLDTSTTSATPNPRAQVLQNFKEISRIITYNYLTQKKITKKAVKTSLPMSE